MAHYFRCPVLALTNLDNSFSSDTRQNISPEEMLKTIEEKYSITWLDGLMLLTRDDYYRVPVEHDHLAKEFIRPIDHEDAEPAEGTIKYDMDTLRFVESNL